jgi:hypothetical protein
MLCDILNDIVWELSHLSDRIKELEEQSGSNWNKCSELWNKIYNLREALNNVT